MDSPESDFNFGLGLVTASISGLVTWVLSQTFFSADINPGVFSGTIAMGLYYIYRGIKRGKNNA